MAEPSALPAGCVLSERFEVDLVLGRGGFGIAYLANDLARRDQVVIKELAPAGVSRTDKGVVKLDPEVADLLRQRFLEEAKVLGRLNVLGVPPVRASFRENGTAYFVTEHVPEAVTLDSLIRSRESLEVAQALDIFHRLLDTLEAVHNRGYLHRDVKPSNVLVSPSGFVTLIDFGAAREWLADAELTHTVLYTPAYAPPEQLSDRARRGPASDLYALCATLYHMLAGEAPASAAERVAGAPLVPIEQLRSELEPQVAHAIHRGLSLAYADRPQSAAELRDLLSAEDLGDGLAGLEAMDDKLVRIKAFHYERRACPACGGLLVEPQPLRKGRCPVCRDGIIRKREILDGICPECRSGVVRQKDNATSLFACPLCRVGRLGYRRKSLLSPVQMGTCDNCAAVLEKEGENLTVVDPGTERPERAGSSLSVDAWREESRRSPSIRACDTCPGQYDELADGRWLQVVPPPSGRYRSLYLEEWARVASGLEPSAGNAECGNCGADFYLEADRLTLLDAPEDPFDFAEGYLGRCLKAADVSWLGVGKESPHPGVVCETCGTEMDRDGGSLRLERTPNRRLARFLKDSHSLEDWHRLAQGLPLAEQESEFRERMDEALLHAYVNGEIGFDFANKVVWRGPAQRTRDGLDATLTITTDEVAFGKLLRKDKVPMDAIAECRVREDVLHLDLGDEDLDLRVQPVDLVAHLKSGKRVVRLEAVHLAERILHELSATKA
jgi:hypothetical protein